MNKKEFLLISFTIFLTVLAWVIADIYHSTKIKSILQDLPTVQSLKLNFDEKIFEELRKREYE